MDLHEGIMLLVLVNISETIMWNKRYRPNVQSTIHRKNLRSILDVKKIDKIKNERTKELCGLKSA